MKKIIYIFGILFLSTIVILNIFFTANMNAKEHIINRWNSITYIISIILIVAIIYDITKIVNKYLYEDDSKEKKKKRKILLIVALVIYIVFSIIWVIVIRPSVADDQYYTCSLAQGIYNGNVEEILNKNTYIGVSLGKYMQAYKQQISLAFLYSVFFRIIRFDSFEALRAWNVIGNILIILALYKISKHLTDQYKTNKVLLFTLILTFVSLTMLSTFVYGDIPSLSLCLFAVYFMMKYTKTKKWKYALIASIFTMIAYMIRMNSLIFIIATVMYLVLNLLKEITKKTWKENIINTVIIIAYIIISIFPSSIIQNYYLGKYELEKDRGIPTISYLLMAMDDKGPRANGWYNGNIGGYAVKNPEKAKEEYKEKLKDRLTYFSKNIGYTFKFYLSKIASTWTENTYSAIKNNKTKEYGKLEYMIKPLTFYQKALLIITCFCSLIVLIQNRKNLSLDLLFLVTIFIGGFAFHILWETKSRYIIPYIVVLIPVASISIKNFKINEKIKEHISISKMRNKN